MQFVHKVEDTLELENFNNLQPVKFLSEKTKQNPKHITLALLTVTTCFLLFVNCGQRLLLLVVSFLYPVYQSFLALQSKPDHDNKRWLTYWTVFGFIFAFSGVTEFVLDYLPLGKVLLAVFFFLLYCPLTNGYEYVYELVIKKVLQTYQVSIDKYLSMAKTQFNDHYKKAKVAVAEKLVEEEDAKVKKD